MPTAFQPGAVQVSGFQVVAVASTVQPSGGWLEGAWHMGRRPVLHARKVSRKKRELERQIERLEKHIAAERKVPLGTIQLEVRAKLAPLPPYALMAIDRALQEQSRKAIQQAYTAILKAEREEEEDFAVLMSLALH